MTFAPGTGKSVAAAARDRMGRIRVCGACVTAADVVLGGVHSELACDRCGVAPRRGWLRRIGLVLVVSVNAGGRPPTRLWLERARVYDRRTRGGAA